MLVVYDVWSGWLQGFDLPRHNTHYVEMALRKFAGRPQGEAADKIKYIYCDGAPELTKACDALGIDCDTSMPGAPSTNAIAERQVQTVLRGTRAALRASGLPLAFWPYAMTTCCHLRNLQRRRDGTSPYTRRFPGSSYKGLKLPFGGGR